MPQAPSNRWPQACRQPAALAFGAGRVGGRICAASVRVAPPVGTDAGLARDASEGQGFGPGAVGLAPCRAGPSA